MQVGASTEPVRNMMLRLTQPFNVTGHPAISMPSGRTASGLPCSFSSSAAAEQTDTLLKVAIACEPHRSA